MGMAASQARFLQLTGRKTNIEYMGQQINQQRLALANQSAGLFEKMLTLEPPTPPSSLDDKYYTQGYTFNDPADEMSKKISWSSIEDMTAADTAISITYTGGAINPSTEDVTFQDLIDAGYTNSETDAGTAAFAGVEVDAQLQALATAVGVTAPQDDTSKMVLRAVTIEHAVYDPDGNYQTVQEQAPAILEFDNLNRLINITLLNDVTGSASDYDTGIGTGGGETALTTALGADNNTSEIGQGEELTYSGVFDETAYNDDMNKYEFEKSAYDYQIERINLETAKIQKQDKSLELKMKQLDTEHKAISTEMDAVSKVIQKNIESTFKTFG